MGKNDKVTTCLIADPDRSYLTRMEKDPRKLLNPLIMATTGREAQMILADKTKPLFAAFIHHKLADPSGLSVARFAFQTRPGLPVFLLHDDDLPLSPKELKQYGVRGALKRADTYGELIAAVHGKAVVFDEAAARSFEEGAPPPATTTTPADKNFIPMKIREFFPSSKTLFDVYVRLESGKYLKVLKLGDDFSEDRLESYTRKGVQNFYITRDAQEHYLHYLDKHAVDALQKQETTWKFKMQHVLTQGERTLDFLRAKGLSPSHLEYASDYFANVVNLVRKIDPSARDMIRDFISDVSCFDHAVGTALVAGLFTRPLRFDNKKVVDNIGFAAFFHDVGLFGGGLYATSPAILTEDESKMNDEERALFRMHPSVGAEALGSVKGIDSVVVQAVLQHHERVNKTGFPNRLGMGEINPVAEMIAVSDELYKLIKRAADNPELNPFTEMQKILPGNFSNALQEVFRKVFTGWTSWKL